VIDSANTLRIAANGTACYRVAAVARVLPRVPIRCRPFAAIGLVPELAGATLFAIDAQAPHTMIDSTNPYLRQLTPDEIAAGEHRHAVGGMWDEIGRLQRDFFVACGLRPDHRFVDVGCGSLRGGIHFVAYLAPGNYHGLDINRSLIDAGRLELKAAGLERRNAKLLVNDQFDLSLFKTTFDFGLAQSVFTHIPFNCVVRCLSRVRDVLAPHGRFFATFFQAPRAAYLDPLPHERGGICSHYDADPFHLSFEEIGIASRLAGLAVDLIGDWNHPRDQQMLEFRHPSA
jgi:SAM-dependent methyltransferase